MATLVLRNVKGSPLTNTEMDNNFSNLNSDIQIRLVKSGDTMTGPLTLSGDPSSALHATTKQYADAVGNNRLPIAGGSMSGKITFVTPTTATASVMFPQGNADPTTPANGDSWNNGGAIKIQIGASTKQFAFTDSPITGNASTATKWAVARTITLGGDSSGAVTLDGSSDQTLSTTIARASTLRTPRTLTATGDGSWAVTFDGSASVSAALTLATVNSAPGTVGDGVTVPVITVNAKGLVTAANTASIRAGSTSVAGIVQLSDSIATSSSTLAATSLAVKTAYDLAALAPSITYVNDRVKIYNAAGTRLL